MTCVYIFPFGLSPGFMNASVDAERQEQRKYFNEDGHLLPHSSCKRSLL